jgi:hypothetical protein
VVTDLPTGFVAVPHSSFTSNDFCPEHDPMNQVRELAAAEATFQNGQLGPVVVEVVALYPDATTAQQFMSAVATATTACGSWIGTDFSGTPSKYSLSPLSFDRVGDETAAMRFDAQTMVSVVSDLIFVRRGAYVLLLGNVMLGPGLDSAATKSYVTKADSKLRTATA